MKEYLQNAGAPSAASASSQQNQQAEAVLGAP